MIDAAIQLLRWFTVAILALIFLYTAAQLVTLGVVRALRKMKGKSHERQ